MKAPRSETLNTISVKIEVSKLERNLSVLDSIAY